MNTIKPPCSSEACIYAEMPVGEGREALCTTMFDVIQRAGGVALLETTICPFRAMAVLGPKTDPESVRLKSRLGFVGYFEYPALDD